jgi:hypothetical protein
VPKLEVEGAGTFDVGKNLAACTLLHGCCTRVQREFSVPMYIRHITCKEALSLSGRCWVRTSDLCRVKSDPLSRGSSLTFRNTCKIAYLPLEAFVSVRRCSRGLVYYWCTSGEGLSNR